MCVISDFLICYSIPKFHQLLLIHNVRPDCWRIQCDTAKLTGCFADLTFLGARGETGQTRL